MFTIRLYKRSIENIFEDTNIDLHLRFKDIEDASYYIIAHQEDLHEDEMYIIENV